MLHLVISNIYKVSKYKSLYHNFFWLFKIEEPMAMKKTSHVLLLSLLLCLMFVIGLVEASIPGGDMGPEIYTPPSGSCGAPIAKYDSQVLLTKRPPPCRRPRLENTEDVTYTTRP
ncbi:uncharacterized protein LOC9304555 [Arabidopsis lyrata subsp. lyrata]|nr:uncharacterized protein LOC9304555 [Arabidopsis lyrata subsp. lyrata]|eukprot:XP_002870493.2 uncharacterized protein LOC9304555 [Arabidopsis lyrata subsp. lyrata]